MASKTFIGDDTGNEGDLATAANYDPSGVPTTGDDLRFNERSAYGVSSGHTALAAVALGDVIFEPGFTKDVGDGDNVVQFDPDRFEYAATGTAYIDLQTAAIDAVIRNAKSATAGSAGLYLIGDNLDEVTVFAGAVGLAIVHGDTATVSKLRVVGERADVYSGEGLTLTTLQILDGEAWLRCNATTVDVDGGTLVVEEAAVLTTLNVNGGEMYHRASGNVTTLNLRGGEADFTGGGVARTLSTFNPYGRGVLVYDPDTLTITTPVTTTPTGPTRVSYSAA